MVARCASSLPAPPKTGFHMHHSCVARNARMNRRILCLCRRAISEPPRWREFFLKFLLSDRRDFPQRIRFQRFKRRKQTVRSKGRYILQTCGSSANAVSLPASRRAPLRGRPSACPSARRTHRRRRAAGPDRRRALAASDPGPGIARPAAPPPCEYGLRMISAGRVPPTQTPAQKA